MFKYCADIFLERPTTQVYHKDCSCVQSTTAISHAQIAPTSSRKSRCFDPHLHYCARRFHRWKILSSECVRSAKQGCYCL